ncbi:hypothetical protein [Peptoniphilus vaginalis]|uniref:hypothetical protein n=2 Tax=Peptoniphilus vaginalis TaxID=1756987 RepID=UPI000A26F3F4|nr:hypothetical protein [Peptoniphilus vaginalis]
MKISNRICSILLAGLMLLPSASVWAEEDTQNKSSQSYQTRDAGDENDAIPIGVQSKVSAQGLKGKAFPWNTYFKNMGYGQIGVYKQWITYFKDSSSYQADPNEGSHFSTGYEDGSRPKNIPTLTWSFDIPPLNGEFYGFHSDNNFSERKDIPATYEESTGWIQEKANHSVWSKGELHGVYTMETKIMEHHKPMLNVSYKTPYGTEFSASDQGDISDMVPEELKVKFLTSDKATNDDIDAFDLPKEPGDYNLWEIGDQNGTYVFDSYAFTKEMPQVAVLDNYGTNLVGDRVWTRNFRHGKRVKSIKSSYVEGVGGKIELELMPKIMEVPADQAGKVPDGYQRITLDANGTTIGNQSVSGKIQNGNFKKQACSYLDVRNETKWNDGELLQKLRAITAQGDKGEIQNEEHPWTGKGLENIFSGKTDDYVETTTLKANYEPTKVIIPKDDVADNPGDNYVTLTLHGTSKASTKERGDGKIYRKKDGKDETKGNQVNFWIRKETPIDFATIDQIMQATDGYYPKADSPFMTFKAWHTDERATDANILGEVKNGVHTPEKLIADSHDVNLYASYEDQKMADKWKNYLQVKDINVLQRRILNPEDDDIKNISDQAVKDNVIKDIQDLWKGAVEKRQPKPDETFPEEIQGDIPIEKVEDQSSRNADTAGDKVGNIKVTFKDGSTLELKNQKVKVEAYHADYDNSTVFKAGDTQEKVTLRKEKPEYKGGSVAIALLDGETQKELLGKATLDSTGNYIVETNRQLVAGEKIRVQVMHPGYKTEGHWWTKWVQLNTGPLKESYDLGNNLYDKLGKDNTLDKTKKDALKKAIDKAKELINDDGSPKVTTPNEENQKALDKAKKTIDEAIKNLGGNDLLTLLPYLQVKALAVWEGEKPSQDDFKAQVGLNDNVESDPNKDKIKATWDKVKDKITFEIPETLDTNIQEPKAMKMITSQVKIKLDENTSLNKNFDLYVYPDLAIDPNKDKQPSDIGFLPLPKDYGYLAFVPGTGIEKIKDNSLYIYKAKDDFKLLENQFPILSADGEKVKDALLPSLKLKAGSTAPVTWKAMDAYEITKPASGSATYMTEEDLLNNDFKQDPKPTLKEEEVNNNTVLTTLPKVKVLGEKGKEVTVLVANAKPTNQAQLPKPVISQGHNTDNGETTITGTITGQPQGTKLALYILGNKVDIDPIPYDKEGKFTVTLPSTYNTSGVERKVYHGDSVEVKAYYEGTDAAYGENVSDKLILDKKAPEIKNIVSENMPGQAQKISGSIQDENLPGKITLKTSDNATIRTVDIGDNGTFIATIRKPARGGSIVLIAEDKFGNKTDETDMRNLADQPQISVSVEQPFAGETEILVFTVPGAKVEVFTKNGETETLIGSAIATFDSMTVVKLESSLVKEQTIYVKASKYGYQSQATDTVITVK